MSTTSGAHTYRLVIIDDQPEFLHFAQQELEGSSALTVVGTVQDGSDAPEVIARTQPDAVLIDIFMPSRNGFEIGRLLAARFPDLVIVYLSVDNVMQYPTMQEQLGEYTFISKKWLSETYVLAVLTYYRRRGWNPPSFR